MNIQMFYQLRVKPFIYRDKIILNSKSRKTKRNRVNLHYWELERNGQFHNLGDWLSPIIVNYVLKEKGLSLDTPVKGMSHLYAIGSIIGVGYQSATIWGSGFIDSTPEGFSYRFRKFDVRCVRGSETRNVLLSLGYSCPEVYGDPAILLPLYYRPIERKKKEEVVVIPHYLERDLSELNGYKIINVITDDWKKTIDEIYNSKLVISSSLHGIILAEAYGIPAVLWKPENKTGGGTTSDPRSLFKYNDYYNGTGRFDFPVVKNIEDAFSVKPVGINNLDLIQQNLLKSFPYDLWE